MGEVTPLWHHGGATILLHMQTIQQSSDKVVPPYTSMVCGADNAYLYEYTAKRFLASSLGLKYMNPFITKVVFL